MKSICTDYPVYQVKIRDGFDLRAVAVPPVGLHGKFSIKSLQPGCQAARSASTVSAKLSFANVGTGTATPCASVMLG